MTPTVWATAIRITGGQVRHRKESVYHEALGQYQAPLSEQSEGGTEVTANARPPFFIGDDRTL